MKMFDGAFVLPPFIYWQYVLLSIP